MKRVIWYLNFFRFFFSAKPNQNLHKKRIIYSLQFLQCKLFTIVFFFVVLVESGNKWNFNLSRVLANCWKCSPIPTKWCKLWIFLNLGLKHEWEYPKPKPFIHAIVFSAIFFNNKKWLLLNRFRNHDTNRQSILVDYTVAINKWFRFG